MRNLLVILSVVLIMTAGSLDRTYSQDADACTALVTEALQVVGSACAEMGRDEACYGHALVTARFQDGVSVNFDGAGDTASLVDLETLVTQTADPAGGTWGVALLSLQADLPGEVDQPLTLVLIGDAELVPAVPDDSLDGVQGQAFILRSGETSACETAPNGLLVDAPAGQRARVLVNGVELMFGSSGFLTAEADGALAVSGLTGAIDVRAADEAVTVSPGEQTSVPLDALAVAGPPSAPAAADLGNLPGLRRSLITGAPYDPASATDLNIDFVPGAYTETWTVVDVGGVTDTCFFSGLEVGRVLTYDVTISREGDTLVWERGQQRFEGTDLGGGSYQLAWVSDTEAGWVSTTTMTFTAPTTHVGTNLYSFPAGTRCAGLYARYEITGTARGE